MARIAFDKKTGCTKSKSVAREYDSETGSTFKSARNGPKSREIDRTPRALSLFKLQHSHQLLKTYYFLFSFYYLDLYVFTTTSVKGKGKSPS